MTTKRHTLFDGNSEWMTFIPNGDGTVELGPSGEFAGQTNQPGSTVGVERAREIWKELKTAGWVPTT